MWQWYKRDAKNAKRNKLFLYSCILNLLQTLKSKCSRLFIIRRALREPSAELYGVLLYIGYEQQFTQVYASAVLPSSFARWSCIKLNLLNSQSLLSLVSAKVHWLFVGFASKLHACLERSISTKVQQTHLQSPQRILILSPDANVFWQQQTVNISMSNCSGEAPAWLRSLLEADLFFLVSISFTELWMDLVLVLHHLAVVLENYNRMSNIDLFFCFLTQRQWCCSWLVSLLPWIIQPMRTKQQVTKWPIKRL